MIVEADAAIKNLTILAHLLNVQSISDIVLQNPKFRVWSGSSSPYTHHYGSGGLAVHTFEVVDLCLKNNDYFNNIKQIPRDQLFLAALFHDTGKMWDYQPIIEEAYFESDITKHIQDSTAWEGSLHKRNVHHISRSALVWNEAVTKYPKYPLSFDPDLVLHAILAHHGRREWGSPVSPNTRLAWMLHLCDGISARMDDAGQISD